MLSFDLAPGTVIGVDVTVWGVTVLHVGIVTERVVDGERTVISHSLRHGGTVEETLASFCDGKWWRVVGYLGRDAWEVVLDRARSDASVRRPWSLLWDNCEHAVRRWHGLAPESPQLRQAIGAAGGIGLASLLVFSAVGLASRR
jgi:hypothetical protein